MYLSGAMETVNPKAAACAVVRKSSFAVIFPGSKKIYPFYIEAAAAADTVEVYEAPIDAMSGASLKIMQHTGNWRGIQLSGAGRYGLRCTGFVSYILPEHNPHCPVP